LGIIAHFTSQSGVRINPVLGLWWLEGPHTGANMAGVITEVLKSYGTGIEEKLGYVVGDNASNNDTLVRVLSDDQVFSNQSGLYDASQRRLCCIGHVINLVEEAFWIGDVDRSLLHDTVVVTQDTMAHWLRMGPWGKAHNLTVYSLASPQRRQELKTLGSITVLHRDNATRWNAGYSMIQSMMGDRDAVNVFCARHSELDQDRLHPSEWDQLAAAISILELVQSATLRIEYDFSELHNILVELDFFRTTFTSVVPKCQTNPHYHIRCAAAEGITVLDKYHDIYKSLIVCVAAVVLHPAYKWEYFQVAVTKMEWSENELQDAKCRVQGLWLTEYKSTSSETAGHNQSKIPSVPTTPFATWRAQRQRELIG
jgi:hypothetical protein